MNFTMNIKEKIGKRIQEARHAMGLTVKELANQTRSLKPSRISNWEYGGRTPGPTEILQLAEVLKVDPAYLMCLSDISSQKEFHKQLVPIVSLKEAHKFKTLIKQMSAEGVEKFDHLIIDQPSTEMLFAIKINDLSMMPEFVVGDYVVIDPKMKLSPGRFVLVHSNKNEESIFRKYRVVSDKNEKNIVELVPLNSDWPVITLKDPKSYQILGVCVEHRRYNYS